MTARRFTPLRAAGIVGWTTVAILWVGGVVARVTPAGPDGGDAAGPAPRVVDVASVPRAGPELPEGGLIVIRHTPAPTPATGTRTIVVREAPQPPPPTVVSSGS